MTRTLPDATAFIRANLRPGPAPMLPEITLYQAHPGSGLSRLGRAPYWAHVWAGGAALARHFLQNPGTVRGLRVLDLGAGSGVVGIAAAKAGAAQVICAETDPFARAAIALNAALNSVQIEVMAGDVTALPPLDVDLIAAGDVFYSADLAAHMTAYLGTCHAAGVSILVGDPGRAFLPRHCLQPMAEYPVRDFGQGANAAPTRGAVFTFAPPADLSSGAAKAGLAH